MSTRVVVFVEGGNVQRVIAEDDIDVVVLYADVDDDMNAVDVVKIDGTIFAASRHMVNGDQDATECAVMHDAVTGE